MQIVIAGADDDEVVMGVEGAAFARDDEPQLVAALLRDPTAQPCLSLLAYEGARPVGHALFTRVLVMGGPHDLPSSILAPLAVIPAFQRRGVGRALIEHGAGLLAKAGVGLLFVLGNPDYYSRCGFVGAMPHGLLAPYPIVPAEAWMVRGLGSHRPGAIRGTVACASSLDRPELWRE